MRMPDQLYQIKSKYFTAGILVNTKGIVTGGAPILAKAIGMKWKNVEKFYRGRGCTIIKVEERDEERNRLTRI